MRVSRVKAMTEALATSIGNYWSAHIYQSRLKRYGVRATRAREAHARVDQQYASLRAAVLRRQQGALASCDQEQRDLQRRHGDIFLDSSSLVAFYASCFDGLREGLHLGRGALERAVCAVRRETRRQVVAARAHCSAVAAELAALRRRRPEASLASSSPSAVAAAAVSMVCWRAWPSGGGDCRAMDGIDARLRGGEEAIQNMMRHCSSKINGESRRHVFFSSHCLRRVFSKY